jgi:hypothetical protein
MAMETADTLLSDIERLRRRTRTDLHPTWFPLVVFGTLSMASAAVAVRFGPTALGFFWAVAAPLGSVATGFYYWRRQDRVGLQAPAAPYLVGAAGIVLGAFLTGGLGGAFGAPAVSALGPPLFVSAGYLLFARLARSRGLAAVAVVLALVTVATGVARIPSDRAAWTLALIYGAIFVATGLVFRASQTGGP